MAAAAVVTLAEEGPADADESGWEEELRPADQVRRASVDDPAGGPGEPAVDAEAAQGGDHEKGEAPHVVRLPP
jgi:hypothetical protein